MASVLGIITVGIGLRRRRTDLMRLSRPWAVAVLAGAVLATIAMERALLTNDFSLVFVAENHSRATPLLFTISTLWAALEGSIILWALVLAGYAVAMVVRFRDRLSDPLMAWAMVTMFAVCLFFFGLMAGPADPFSTVAGAVPADGPGPNPLLQNHPLMAFHPPMLYLGYVGFTVPFAFAVGALVTGRLGEGWLAVTRRWTLLAWGFLTLGIGLGAWWSYEVLGWGGYWGWDPVENASLLPWLTGTAYLHSVMVQERRGMLRVWNLALLCATFALTILGTFITRSGVLDSVHAFSESDIGVALLAFFAVIVIVTVGLIGWRGDRLHSPGAIHSPLSREGAFLANNVVFAAFAFVVLLGTVFPLVVEALNDDRISVGTPYFNRMTTPIGLSLLFLMAVAPALPWRKASGELLRHRLQWPAWGGTLAVVGAVTLGARGLAPLVAFGLGGFAGVAAARQLALSVRRQGVRGLVGRTNGGMLVHLGVVVVAVAIAASQSYTHDAEFRLGPGESGTVAGHTVTYLGTETDRTARKTVTRARVRVDGGRVFEPALNHFPNASQAIGTPSVRTGFTEDVYLTLVVAPTEQGGDAVIGVIIQPLVTWLWIGGGIMGLGTLLAAWPDRRRRQEQHAEPASRPVAGNGDGGAGTGSGSGATRHPGPGRPADDSPATAGSPR